MNTDTGQFVRSQPACKWAKTIAVGEVHKINGEECKVTKIGDREVTLQLMSKREREVEAEISQTLNRHDRRKAERLGRR